MPQRKNEANWIENRQRWQINVRADGMRKTFVSSTTGKKGKIEAEHKADQWLECRLVNENTRTDKMLDKWYEKLKVSTSQSHYRQYDNYIRNWIKPLIGQKKINRLTQNDLQSVVDNAYKKGDLAEKTLRNIRACIMSFMKYCRNSKVTAFTPDTITIPASAKKSVKTIATVDDIAKLFNCTTTVYRGKVIEDDFVYAYRFCVLTGMRPGELLGLLWSNIKGEKITITQSFNDRGELTQGKNKNARRTYILDYHATKVLEEQKKLMKRKYRITPVVFPYEDGEYALQHTFRQSWKRYCSANGITGANTPYELRHTFVSINDEMPEALKKMVVGHSTNMDTEGIYGHEKTGDMQKAAAYISTAFSKILGW